MNCFECKFAEPSVLAQGGPVLLCRRFPPKIYPDPEGTTQGWPQMEETDWCGEFKEKDAQNKV